MSSPSDTSFDTSIARLLALMAALRHPETGCAWDVAQTFSSIAPYTIEEAYEVADAIERGDAEDLRDELGDLLLQVVFHARMAEEAGTFAFGDVVAAIVRKLVRRHPHVFAADGSVLATGEQCRDPAEVSRLWERVKAQERASKPTPPTGPLVDIARALPALSRAEKLARKAAGYGFDWPQATDVLAKIREEVDEVEDAMRDGRPERIDEEIGDLLFSVANLARHYGIDAEYSLRKGNDKFERRFTAMAALIAQEGRTLAGSDLPAMEAAWQAVKRSEA